MPGIHYPAFFSQSFIMKHITYHILFVAVILSSCAGKQKIADAADYTIFLSEGLVEKQVKQVNEDLLFWQNDLQRDTGSYVPRLELASAYLRRFKLTGSTADLAKGDSLLKRSSARLADTDPDILYAIAQNSITQHQFRDAASYNEAADRKKGDPFITTLLRFDAGMELGNYSSAFQNLNRIKDKTSFDYLIRKAKWQDHKGDLNGAIITMEEAFEKIKDREKSLYCWTLSNLADMYGHAGRVRDAYNAYINVLQKDSTYIYALKGIAWIVYSHDGDAKEARRIIQYLQSQTPVPDHWLTLAEIADYEGDGELKQKYIQQFLSQVSQPGYGDMYNKYLTLLYTDEVKDYDKAMQLAAREVANRPTPETYNWLAWVHFLKGEKEKALEYAEQQVYRKTFEPDALLHTAIIFADNGKKKEAKNLLQECLASSFEIGPLQSRKVKEELKKLQ